MKAKQLEYYEWDDFQEAICQEMGIEVNMFYNYTDPISKKSYCDCWHVWRSVFDCNVNNGCYSSSYFFKSDEHGDKDGEWAYIEEKAVKEYGEWSRVFVKAVSRVIDKYNLYDKAVVIYYDW